MSRICSVTLILLFVSMSLAAGLPPELEDGTPLPPEKQTAVISGLLNSGDIREQAWGAHLTAKYNHPEFIPALLKFLTPLPLDQRQWDPSMTARHDLNHVVLDALIQINANVPADQLLSLFDLYPDPLIILFSKHLTENTPTLLSLASKTQNDLYWLALGNLLSNARALGFAQQLLVDLEIEVRVSVRDDNLKTELFTDESGGGCGDGWVGITEGIPPTGIYELTADHDSDVIILCKGTIPIYYRRSEVKPHQRVGVGQCFSEINRNRYRLEYLAKLLKVPTDSLGLNYQHSCFIQWQGMNYYNLDLEEFLKRERKAYAQLVERLVEKNLLTRQEAEVLEPRIRVSKVVDLRKYRTSPLPVPTNAQ
jgi:hypothetical protein